MKKERSFFLSLGISLSLALVLVLASFLLQEDPAPAEPAYSGPTETLTAAQLDSLLMDQPLAVASAGYVVQDPTYKALYPDMLQATVENNSQWEITRLSVAFAAWDEEGQPILLSGRRDLTVPTYLRVVHYTDIAIAPGETFGSGYGYPVNETLGVARVKALAMGCETASGDTWSNPYTAQWAALYEDACYSEDLSVEVPAGAG